jgi:hypothetical protein
VIDHNCSYLVQEGNLGAGHHMVEDPACSSHNPRPDRKNEAASDPSPCYLLVVAAVGNCCRDGCSSEVEAYLLVGIHSQAVFEIVAVVAPTEKLHHDPEDGNFAGHCLQIEWWALSA